MGVTISTNGSYKKTQAYLQKLARGNFFQELDSLAQEGVKALASASPVDSGLSAHSWTYKVEKTAGSCTISWFNTDIENGFPVSIMLQYGYGTGTGGYVQGRDYINPAMKPVFDKIQTEVWKVVTSS